MPAQTHVSRDRAIRCITLVATRGDTVIKPSRLATALLTISRDMVDADQRKATRHMLIHDAAAIQNELARLMVEDLEESRCKKQQ